MYLEHNPLIAAGMVSDPEIFGRGLLFSAMSAQQPIVDVPKMLLDVDRLGEDAPGLQFPNKFACWQFLQNHSTRTWRETLDRDTPEALIYLARNVPGLGIVKAAFTLQLLGRDIGCLDRHNIKREKVHLRAFDHRGTVKGYSDGQVRLYLKHAGGRSRELWDRWCDYVAPRYQMTGEEISALHLAIVN